MAAGLIFMAALSSTGATGPRLASTSCSAVSCSGRQRGALAGTYGTGTPEDLKGSLGDHVTLDDVFRHYTGGTLHDEEQKGGIRNVRRTRSTARRLG